MCYPDGYRRFEGEEKGGKGGVMVIARDGHNISDTEIPFRANEQCNRSTSVLKRHLALQLIVCVDFHQENEGQLDLVLQEAYRDIAL
jgi:hypothetical protein